MYLSPSDITSSEYTAGVRHRGGTGLVTVDATGMTSEFLRHCYVTPSVAVLVYETIAPALLRAIQRIPPRHETWGEKPLLLGYSSMSPYLTEDCGPLVSIFDIAGPQPAAQPSSSSLVPTTEVLQGSTHSAHRRLLQV